jgi:hypothetical protein
MEDLLHGILAVAPDTGPRRSAPVSVKKLLPDCTQGGMTDPTSVVGIGDKLDVLAVS